MAVPRAGDRPRRDDHQAPRVGRAVARARLNAPKPPTSWVERCTLNRSGGMQARPSPSAAWLASWPVRALPRPPSLVPPRDLPTQGPRPAEVLQRILERIPYHAWLEAQKDGQAKLKAVDNLLAVLEATAAPDVGTWLVDMQLGESEGPAAADGKCVTLTTIHGAKGCAPRGALL